MNNLDLPAPPTKKLKTEHSAHELLNSKLSSYTTQKVNMPETTKQVTQDQREADVGILEFVYPDTLGFQGIFKKRYTDFIVNEILPSGEVVHLSKLNATKKKISLRKDENQKLPNEGGFGFDDNERPANIEPATNLNEGTPDDGAALEAKHHEVSDNNVNPNTNTDHSLDPDYADKQMPPSLTQGDTATNDTALSNQDINVQAGTGQTKSDVESEAIAIWEQSREKEQIKITPEDKATLQRFFDDETVDKCVDLFNKVINSPHRSRAQYGLVHSKPIADRDLRKEAHEAIKRIFRLRLETETDNQGVIEIASADSRGSAENRNGLGAQRNRWPSSTGRGGRGGQGPGNRGRQNFGAKKSQKEVFMELGGDYLHFTLFKENKDTLEVISYLSRQLHMKANAFQFAGNKDRRAVTSQRVSVYRVFPDKLASLNTALRNAKVGNYAFQQDKIKLGDLQGNAFCITLRDCVLEDDTTRIDAQLESLKERVRVGMEAISERGFINYFGLQRFGSFATRTDHIGKKLLQGDFKGAVDGILEYSPVALAAATDQETNPTISRDDRDRATALNIFRSGGPIKQALDTLPRKFSAENNILRWLGNENHANDYRGALDSIPRNLRSMYVHAYQSLIWNLAVTHRWKLFGDRLVEGDLVLVSEHENKVTAQGVDEDVDAEGEVVIRPAEEDRAITANERFERARALTAEDIASGRYSIFDVVFPTPGFDILYPEYMVSFYKETMGSEEYGGLDPFDMVRKWREISLSGSYRKILARPMTGSSWDACIYEDEDQQLVSTDLDTIHARRNAPDKPVEENRTVESKPAEIDAAGANEQGADDGAEIEALQPEATSSSNGPASSDQVVAKRLGVILNFKLGTSQYATMALRELMKHGGAKEYKPDFSAGRGLD